jgi:hypothetical protein
MHEHFTLTSKERAMTRYYYLVAKVNKYSYQFNAVASTPCPNPI